MSRYNPFIERSIMGALSFLKDSLFAEHYASRRGFLQARDPAVKAASILLLLLAVLFTHSHLVLAVLYGATLLLAQRSSIRLGYFLKRSWCFIPLFSLAIAVPALFSVFTPGQALFDFTLGGVPFVVTRQGAQGAALFILRVTTSVSLAVLLTLTTRHSRLLRVLRDFKVPQVFVLTAGMTYRYIFLLIEIIERTYTAIKSRVGSVAYLRSGQRIVAWNIAYLWQRSYHMNMQVYDAMLSRGYTGEPRVLEQEKAGVKDWFWFAGAAACCIGLLWKQYLN